MGKKLYKLGICVKLGEGSWELGLFFSGVSSTHFSGVRLKDYLADQGSFNL